MPSLTSILTRTALVLPVLPAAAQQQIPYVIIETDMAGDCDDAAMVAFAHRLADLGRIQLLAVMHNGNNEWGGAAISAINTYYGRPELPIGTYRTAAEAGRPTYDPLIDPLNPSAGRRQLAYTGVTPSGGWVRVLAENYPCQYRRRLEFPDAVDVYKQVLAQAPLNSVVISNGGFLGNLSNVFAQFDVDTELKKLFQRRVRRTTGAVGGVNTCANEFPFGLAQHVVNNPFYPTTRKAWLGPPVLDLVATQTGFEFANRMPLDNPVRESYRYKSENEHGNRGTSAAWRWHIIDVLTTFSIVAWDDWQTSAGHNWFNQPGPEWMDVVDNCRGRVTPGTPPQPHWRFGGVGANVPPGQTLSQVSQAFKRRFFDDGLYPPPADKWSPERDHLAITAMFEDGTLGGLHQRGGSSNAGVHNNTLVVPMSTNSAQSGGGFVTEGRRYQDQTAVIRVTEVPRVDQHPISQTTSANLDYVFWGDLSSTTHWGQAPLVRVRAWPGRGWGNPAAPGDPVYRVDVWEHTSSGYRSVATADVQNTAVGQAFTMRVQVSGSTVQCVINDEQMFSTPVQLQSAPPADGGMSQVLIHGRSPAPERFVLPYVLIRPSGGGDTIPGVDIDRDGRVWFSYIKNGDFQHDLLVLESGRSSHFVHIEFGQRLGWPGNLPITLGWQDQNPNTLDWLDVVGSAEWRAVGRDHWVYKLEGLPWRAGDEVVLEYRGVREGEQIPAR